MTTTEKKLLRTLVAQPAAYDELCDALGAPRDRIITAMHHLRSLGLVTREGLSWRRT